MARKRMITRTVKGTKYITLCLNTETCEPFNKEVVVGEVFKSTEKRDNTLRKMIDTEIVKFVSVVDSEEVETLYGMDESWFIANAEILPARAVKEEVTEVKESEVC